MSRIRLPVLSRRVRVAVVIAVVALLFVGSVMPVSAGSLPDVVPVLGDDAAADEPGTGTEIPVFAVFHVIGYAVLAFALAYWQVESKRSRVLFYVGIFVVTVAYGAAIELIQGTIPYRQFSYWDMVLNAIGAALGLLSWAVLSRFVAFVDS